MATSSSSSEEPGRGGFAAGVVQTVITRPDDPSRRLPTTIWYPARAGTGPSAGAPHPLNLPHDATPELEPLPGPFPLIVFSHGNSGYREQSTFLTTRLARAGFVVAAPDHVGNTFPEMLALPDDEARLAVHRAIRRHRPADLHAVICALVGPPDASPSLSIGLSTGHPPTAAESRAVGVAHPPSDRIVPPRLPLLDPHRLGSLGHSFGGWTALKLPALDRRVRAVCALAPVSEAFVGRRAFEPRELPLPAHVRSLVLAARDDVLVDLETSLRPLYERLGRESVLEILDDMDHFHFCDGIELLHRLHESSPREIQRRPTRPYRELRGERETQTLLADRIQTFFSLSLSGPEATST